MDKENNNLYWDFHQYSQYNQQLPNFENIPQGCVWVPCIPDFNTNTYVPIYNLHQTFNFSPNTNPEAANYSKSRISRGGIRTVSWKENEENLLQDLVSLHGLKKWALVAQEINKEFHDGNEVRKGKHCRERWHNHLNPELNKGEWAYEEDIHLLQLKEQYGNKWSLIAKELPGRNENNVKNRWNCLIKKAKQNLEMQYCSPETIAAALMKELCEEMSNRNG